MQEEVAEAVQQARRERLRDDVLGMVCPSDWTIQAEEPPGAAWPRTPFAAHANSSHQQLTVTITMLKDNLLSTSCLCVYKRQKVGYVQG